MARIDLRRVLVAASTALLATLFAQGAWAQRGGGDAMGSRGQLSIDQISGFRVSGVGAGFAGGGGYGIRYDGIVGFSTQSVGIDQLGGGTNTGHFTSFWIAPSADYFVIDHLSIGGLLEVATTSASVDEARGNGNVTLPSTTSFTLLPRVGWLFDITDRFAIWPRGGIGYGSQSQASSLAGNGTTATETFSSLLIDIDCGFLFRIGDIWYLKAAPELTLMPGNRSLTEGNGTVSVHESVTQFGISGGVGVMWDLL